MEIRLGFRLMTWFRVRFRIIYKMGYWVKGLEQRVWDWIQMVNIGYWV